MAGRNRNRPVKAAQKALAARKLMDAIRARQENDAALQAATPEDVAEAVLEGFARGDPWPEIREMYQQFPQHLRPAGMDVTAILNWAIQLHTPAEIIKHGRNIMLERYRQMIRAVWDKALAGDLPAMEQVRKTCKDIREIAGLDVAERKVIALKRLEDMTDDELRHVLGEIDAELAGNGALARTPPAGRA